MINGLLSSHGELVEPGWLCCWSVLRQTQDEAAEAQDEAVGWAGMELL